MDLEKEKDDFLKVQSCSNRHIFAEEKKRRAARNVKTAENFILGKSKEDDFNDTRLEVGSISKSEISIRANDKNAKCEIKHLVYLYLMSLADRTEYKSGHRNIYVKVDFLCEMLDLSERHIRRQVQELENEKWLTFTGKYFEGHKVYTVNNKYQYGGDWYMIPLSLLKTKSLNLQQKLFILRLHLMTENERISVISFASKNSLRIISNNTDLVTGMMEFFQKNDLVTLRDKTYLLDLKRVYNFINEVYIQEMDEMLYPSLTQEQFNKA